jgi:hypothetical protein
MKYKEPVMGFEPATHALRKRCSTPELHRLLESFKRIINTLGEYLTLAIIPLRILRVKHFYLPRRAFHTLPYNKVIRQSPFTVPLYKTK